MKEINGRNILDERASDLLSFLPCAISLITKHIVILWNSFPQDPWEWETEAKYTYIQIMGTTVRLVGNHFKMQKRYKPDFTLGN